MVGLRRGPEGEALPVTAADLEAAAAGSDAWRVAGSAATGFTAVAPPARLAMCIGDCKMQLTGARGVWASVGAVGGVHAVVQCRVVSLR